MAEELRFGDDDKWKVEDLKDLRGVQHRFVERDDSVIITGAEYLKKGRRLMDAEFERDRYRKALTYVVERVDREFTNLDQPPELDFVLLAVNEVRDLIAPAPQQNESQPEGRDA